MLYYLLYNSSFIKKKKDKEKILFTLIGGSIIYIIIHAIISFSFKIDISRYFWMVFFIDCSAIFISSDFQGFSSLNVVNITDKPSIISNTQQIVEEYIEKNSDKEPEKPILKKVSKKKNLKKEKRKKVSFQDSTPISVLKNNTEEEYNDSEAENINLTLENLENINMDTTGSSDISELQNNYLKRKMEDEYSDPGSDLDLEQFEESISQN